MHINPGPGNNQDFFNVKYYLFKTVTSLVKWKKNIYGIFISPLF